MDDVRKTFDPYLTTADENDLFEAQLYLCMTLVDEILDQSFLKGNETHIHTLSQAIENARCKVADLKTRLHKWEAVIGEIESPEPNPIDEIVRRCGWNILDIGEAITIVFNDSKYAIQRVENR